MHCRRSLADDFRALGIAAGDVVMLHASLRAVGEVAGGPDEIHLALGDVLTPAGSLFMYAGCPRYVDEVGRGHLSPEQEAEILDKLPAFDAATARSDRSNGALVELFRTYPGCRVNEHPARFVVRGGSADYLFSRQPWNYPYGHDSIFERFVDLDGKILLLGSDHDNVTFLHYAEHIVNIPGKRIAVFEVPVLENGRRVWKEMKEIDTSGAGAHPNWPERFFAHIVNGYLAKTQNRGGRVGHAHCFLFEAKGLLELALAEMRFRAEQPSMPPPA